MIILVDQDGPLADETFRLYQIMMEKFPTEPSVYAMRKEFWLGGNFPEHLRGEMEEIRKSKGFYLSFDPVPGMKEALSTMLNNGHEVFICTSPLLHYEHCVTEKFEWVDRHFGKEFIEKIILTRDKTLVKGDFIIDDNPDIKGVAMSEWEHIIFDASYNRHITDKRRLNWSNWKDILFPKV